MNINWKFVVGWVLFSSPVATLFVTGLLVAPVEFVVTLVITLATLVMIIVGITLIAEA